LLTSSTVLALTLVSGLIGQPLPAAAAPAAVAAPVRLLAPPDGPATDVEVTATGSGSADLAWNPATWGASANEKYTVLIGGSPFAGCQNIATLTCHVTGGAASTVTLSVRAHGDSPGEYLDSGTVTTTLLPPPLPPTAVAVASTGSGQGTVSWTAPSSWRLSTNKKFDVILDDAVVNTCDDLAFTVTTCAITGAAGPHTVVVRAIGNTGLATDSSTTNFSLVVAPDAPTNLHLTASDAGSGTLEWTPPAWNGNVHQGYTVKIDGNPVDGCIDIPTASCDFTADAITVGATVTAIGDAPTLVAESDQVTLTLLPAPNAPPNVRAAEWVVGGAAVLWDPTSFNGSTINTYTVLKDGDAVPGCVGITATRCELTGTPDSTTSVVVRANGDAGLATDSNPLVVELPELPDAATALTVTNRTLGTTTIDWTAPASWHNNSQQSYTVLVDGVAVGACTSITVTTCDITGHADSNVTVTVRAIGNSAVLHADATLSVDIPDVPDAPTNVRTVATGAGTADIVWDAPDWKHNTSRTYAVSVDGNPFCAGATVAACTITGVGTVSVTVTATGDDVGTLTSDASVAALIPLIAKPVGDVGTVTVVTVAANPVVTVSWGALVDNGGDWSGGDTETYAVQIDGPDGATLTSNGCAVPVAALTCSFTTDTGGAYTVTVTAVNEAGASATSANGSDDLVLHPPTGPVEDVLVDTDPDVGDVTVTWTALAEEAWNGATDREYEVTLESPVGATIDPDTCATPITATATPSCAFTTDVAGRYTAHVKAVSEAGPSTLEGTDTGTVALDVPAAGVTGLDATATVGTGEVAVTWTGLSDADWQGETRHYKVEVTGGTSTDQSCTALATGANSDSATGCSFTATTAGTFTVKVTAVNEVGDSLAGPTDTVHVTLDAPDGPVTGLGVVALAGNATVNVDWDQLPDAQWKDAADREYLVTITGPDGTAVAPNPCTTAPIADSVSPACSFTAASAGTYTVDVVANSEAGPSEAAQATGHVTLDAPSGVVSDVTVTTALDSDSVEVTWPQLTGNAAWSEGETRTYQVTLTDADDNTVDVCASVPDGPAPTCTFTRNTPGSFTIEVIAVNEAGAAASGTTETGAIVLKPTAVVAGLTAAQTPGTDTVQVSWTQQDPADWQGGTTNTYRVTVDGPAGAVLTPQDCTTADVADSATPTCSFTASVGGDYVVKVAPVNEAGLSTGTAASETAHVVLKPTASVTNLRALATNGFGDVVVLWNRANLAAFNGAVTTREYIVTVSTPSGVVLDPNTNTCTTVPDGVAPSCAFTADTSGSYTIKVALANEAGTSDNGTSHTVGLSLSAPTGKPGSVTVNTTPGSGTVAVGWTPLATGEWEGQTHNYQVTIASPPGAAALTSNSCTGAIADSATPQCSFTAGSPGSYTVTVAAVNETGTSSQSTDGAGYVTLAVPTGPVTGLAAAASPGSGVVSVSWDQLSAAGWQGAQQRSYLVTVDRPAGAGALTGDSCTTGPIADSATPQCAFTAPAAGEYTVHVVPRNEVGNGTQAQATRHITLAVPTGVVADPTVTTSAGSDAVQVSWPQLTGDAAWSMGVTRTYKVMLTDADGVITTPCPSVADGPAPSCSFTNGTPGPFTVEVFAVNEAGAALSGNSEPGGIAFQPAAVVTGLTATQAPGSATVQVGWDQVAAADWRGGTTRTYRVTVDGPPGAVLTPQDCTTADVTDSATPTCSFTASVGGGYTVTVAPVTEAGLSTGTAASTVAQVLLAPAVTVSGLAVATTAGSRTVTASWDQAAEAAWNGGATRSYTVTVQTPSGAVLTGSTCATVLDSATPACTFDTDRSGTYTVDVALTNEIGTATATASESGTVALGAPGSPTGVSGTAGTNAIDVSWTAPANPGGGITSYTVTATAADYPTVSCAGTVTTSPCTITGLAAGVEYTVRVAAAGPEGTSAATPGPATVMPAGLARAPIDVPSDAVPAGTASTTAGGSVTITGGGFDPGSTVVLTLYSVPVSLGTTTAGPGGTINATVNLPMGTALGAHTFLASGLNSQGEAVYLAKTVAVANTPPVVNPPVVNPPVNPPATTAPPAAVPPSGMVTALSASRASGAARTVNVTWNAGQITWGTGANRGYAVTVDGPGEQTGGSCNSSVPTTTCTITVDVDGTYLIGVTARTDAGASPAGASTTVVVAGAPGTPTGVRGTARVNSLAVSWTAAGGTVSRYTATATAAAYPARTCTTTTGTSCTITGLAAGVGYTLQVTATGPAGTSAAGTGATRLVPSGSAQVPVAVPASAGVMGSAITVTAGARPAVKGSGYKAGSKVLISLFPGPVALTTATASASGTFSATVLIPRTTRAGRYQILATGLNAGGAARFLTQSVTVRAPAGSSIRQVGGPVIAGAGGSDRSGSSGGAGSSGAANAEFSASADDMPVTGHATGPVILAGFVFLLLGLSLTTAFRRRRSGH
jgi:hypothetical protein